MNLHGYKLKRKSIARLLKREKDKGNKSNPGKLSRLELARRRCGSKIKELKLLKENKGVK